MCVHKKKTISNKGQNTMAGNRMGHRGAELRQAVHRGQDTRGQDTGVHAADWQGQKLIGHRK